ncbi:WYL domain-containing protein [Rhizobium terrae]|uniref:WYL domain-containing protein n=1 Tax=Rhizobium terrae TaxID=2171756 RepID=UPI000E3C84F3|nr:WYL domain-containing protein [Rhizobium terrae]
MAYPDTIADAIDRRKVLEFRYKNVARRVRPHILGRVGKGELAVSAWQISGTGSGWRLFHLDDICDLRETGEGFHGPARGYNPDDPAFSRIIDRI